MNTPLLVYNYKEAVAAVGYHDNFAAYTLCESISAAFSVVGTGPLVLINVLDPAKHTADIAETTVQVNSGVAVLDAVGVLLDKLTVKSGSTALTRDTDYTASFNNDGTLNIVPLAGGKAASVTTLTVTGKKLDPSKVKAADIVGGVDAATGKETGLEVVRQIYPKLSMTPGILLAPRFSMDATVAAALQAKAKEINGVFKAVCIVDIDSTESGATKYTDVKQRKEAQAVSDANAYAVWPCAKVGEVVYSGSALAAALTAYTDAVNADTPNVSPSNKTLAISAACLADGTEVVLDQEQANTVNGFGVATFLNMSGFRLWGNNYIAKGLFLNLTQEELPRHGKKKHKYKKVKKNKSASRAPAGESIEQRPEEIDEREEFGHWEGDTVYSGKGKRKTTRALLTLTERKTRKEIIIAIPNRKAETVVKALDALERKLGARRFRAIFKSITFDNGTEFAAAEELERSCVNKRLPRTKVYFCHPYSSWERGTNENTNGMIRRRFPKGTNFAAVTNAQIAQAENWINNYPRKILGYRSSEIVFRECLRELGIAA